MNNDNMEFYDALKKVSIPVLIQNLLFFSLSFVDTLMVGSLGKLEFSGVGISGQYYFLAYFLIIGLTSALQIYMAQYFGSGNIKGYRSSVGLAIISSFFAVMLFSLPAILIPETVLSFFTKDQELIKMGSKYLEIIGYQYPLIAITLPLATASRSAKDAKLPMRISIISLALNTILNYIFIFGHFGIPALGVRGAAFATLLASSVSLAQYIFLIRKRQMPLNGPISEFLDISKAFVKKAIKTGWTVVGHEIFWSLGYTLFIVVISRSSTDAYASYQISSQFLRLTMIAAMAVSSAATVTIGAQLGANEIQKAIRFQKLFTSFQVKVSFAATALAIVTAYFAVDLFNVPQNIRTLAFHMTVVSALALPFKFHNGMLAAGILRAGGDTKIPVLYELGGMYLGNIPLLYICIYHLNLPYILAIGIAAIGDGFVALLLRNRAKSGIWAKNLVK